MSTRRVVVTGVGLVTPFGLGAPFNWEKITAGLTATRVLTDAKYSKLPCNVAATVPRGKGPNELDISSHFSSSELRTLSLATVYASIATKEALTDSNWLPEDESEKERTGVAIGVGMADLHDIHETGITLDKSYRHISPYFVPRLLTNMAAGHVSMTYGFQGPNHSVSTACATGVHAVGDSLRFIKNGDADVMVCGGTEANVNPLGIAGFCRLRALSTKFNDDPGKASRPFDVDRDGFVMGEGAGILVLEEYQHAVDRKAKIYAEVLGYGMSGDAYHMTSPREDGKGAKRAMTAALKEANVDLDEVGYINAHATSTPKGDLIEINAIQSLFGDHSKSLSVTSSKGAIGHLLGAAGAVETIFTILTCHAAFIPPTANLYEPIDNAVVDLVPLEGKAWLQRDHRRIALCNSFGFGGTNACLCIVSADF